MTMINPVKVSMFVEHILMMLYEHEVKFVDLRFNEIKGKKQHVTIPADQVNVDFFKEGNMFDGSSHGGWKGINESEIVLMPDVGRAVLDSFFNEFTLIVCCYILKPGTMQGYDCDSRSISKRAEDFFCSSGIAIPYYLPRARAFLFDDICFNNSLRGSHVIIDDIEGACNSDTTYDGGNKACCPAVKGGYFPVRLLDS